MIEEFVKAWDANNKILLEKYLKQAPSSYEDIVKDLIDVVINPYTKDNDDVSYPLNKGFDSNNITVLDDGDYQGTRIYIIPIDTDQPSVENYYFTHNYYGSCSGCDTFQAIESDMDYDENGNLIITKEAAKDFHTLALHLLQRFRQLGNEE